MPRSVNRRYLPELDHIRAFACLLVLFYHGLQLIGSRLAHGESFDPSQHWLQPTNPIVAIIQEGHTGVGLFIVLSGFILSFGAVGHDISYWRFLQARILRIYPMLVVCVVVASYARGGNVATIFTSLLPLNVEGGAGGTFAAMLWAVAIEFQCYLVFPLLIAFSNARGSRYLGQFMAVAIILRLLAVWSEDINPRDLSYWTILGRIDQFCIGIVAARLYLERRLDRISAVWFLPAFLLVASSLVVFNRLGGWPTVALWKIIWPTFEGVIWAIFIATYLQAGRILPRPISGLAARFGEVSYSFYLIHFAVLHALINAGVLLQVTGDGYKDALLTTCLVALPIALMIATLTFKAVEKPFLQMRPKYIRRDNDVTPEEYARQTGAVKVEN